MDGRSRSGLKRAIDRLQEKKDYVEANLLKTYMRQIEMAQSLVPPKLGALNETDLQEALGMLRQEGVPLPPKLQHALLVRHVQSKLNQRAWTDVIPVINPWGDGEFDGMQPKLCAMQYDNKLAFFKRILFHDIMIPLLYEGEMACKTVVGLSKACLTACRDVDLLYEDGAVAAGHDECCAIWAALCAVGEVSLSSEVEDRMCLIKVLLNISGPAQRSQRKKSAYFCWLPTLKPYNTPRPCSEPFSSTPCRRLYMQKTQVGAVWSGP